MHEILRAARDRGASDVHLVAGRPPTLRIDGDLTPLPGAIGADELSAFINETLGSRARDALERAGLADGAFHDAQVGTLRLHAFVDRGGLRCAARLLPFEVPGLESLDVPPAVEALIIRRHGLVLVVGPTGSGKTTLLAALVDRLNERHARHIITLEEPVEYVHAANCSVIAQCEIGRDIGGFAIGTRGALRADPDVILIGELREPEAMRCALEAAEAGHLVLASLHTVDAPGALERIVDAFPLDGRAQIRVQIAQTLAGIVALRLVRRARGSGRRAAAEVLIATDAVRNLIRESKIHQLRSAIQTGRSFGMQTLESHLSELLARGEIDAETARAAAERPAELENL
ncbi:MAG: PilT/PilU family type 4a pilus ATPase [Candidatus Eremiobacteraeota bacterium]|nr:PilT/PilU family type 4a pilus ATPase [Candidatus Eremiobacteraeota bacterium]MBV8354549.1 PilT/PilU family type 4a pilus ATPase [Candidatus Eremiobacteraeota bacterium]